MRHNLVKLGILLLTGMIVAPREGWAGGLIVVDKAPSDLTVRHPWPPRPPLPPPRPPRPWPMPRPIHRHAPLEVKEWNVEVEVKGLSLIHI